MTADAPTILATSGGLRPGERTGFEFNALTDFAIELAGVDGRRPKVCYLGTAGGDNPSRTTGFYEAAIPHGIELTHVALFPMPNVADITAHLLAQDVIWVGGGSVAGLLAMWRLHGVDVAMRTAWQAGVVLTGVSAGSICWHVGGTTDSFGPQLQPVTNGLAFLPYGNGVHYDAEPQRRPVLQRLVADGTLPTSFATDDNAGVLYRGTEFVEAVSERDGARAYRLERTSDGDVVETELDTRRL